MAKKCIRNVTVDLDVDTNKLPPTYNESTNVNWENFGNAIIVQAVNDYRKGLSEIRTYAINHTKEELSSNNKISNDIFKEVYRKHELEYARKSYSKNHSILSIESFFNSDFFHCITNFKVDPLYIINEVRREMNIPVLP